MKPFREGIHWPRRVLFLCLVGYAFMTFGRLFSAILVAAVFISLEIIFTRGETNRRVMNEFFSHYDLYRRVDGDLENESLKCGRTSKDVK